MQTLVVESKTEHGDVRESMVYSEPRVSAHTLLSAKATGVAARLLHVGTE